MKKTILISMVFLFLFASTALAQRMAVKVPIANVRSGPGASYRVLWKVEKYYPVNVIKQSNGWCRFQDYEGDSAWIKCSLLDKTRTIVTKSECNVRSGPGTNHKKVFKSEPSVPFKVLKKNGDWYYVEHADKDRGWIKKTLVW